MDAQEPEMPTTPDEGVKDDLRATIEARKELGIRGAREKALRHEQVELPSAAAGALGTSFRPIALDVLLAVCRRLGLPQPTLPPYESNSPGAHSGQ